MMEKNNKILYCILGSIILALITNPIFEYSRLGIFQGGYGGNLFGELLVNVTNIVSLVGYLLAIAFSIILIISNLNFKGK